MNNQFEAVAEAIRNRRTVKPNQMNGQKIPDETIRHLLEMAHWAPTHGRTEPWFFYVYSDDGVAAFCRQHADLYQQHAGQDFQQITYDKLRNTGNGVSHLIVAVMRRGNLPKIPVLEEIAAVSCAIENLLVGASAAGIATFWSTGGEVLKPSMKNFLHLADADQVMGLLCLGYTDAQPPAVRNTLVQDKIIWTKH